MFEKILACQYQVPESFSPEAASLVTGLLQSDPTRRLGAMKGGFSDIKGHPFFAGIDWGLMLEAKTPGPLMRLHMGHSAKPEPPSFNNF